MLDPQYESHPSPIFLQAFRCSDRPECSYQSSLHEPIQVHNSPSRTFQHYLPRKTPTAHESYDPDTCRLEHGSAHDASQVFSSLLSIPVLEGFELFLLLSWLYAVVVEIPRGLRLASVSMLVYILQLLLDFQEFSCSLRN